ncbi:hypothetical protein CMV_021001, partial [Castanea mollissima]
WISTRSDSAHFQHNASDRVGIKVISSSLISDPPVLAPISDWISTRSDSTHLQHNASDRVGDKFNSISFKATQFRSIFSNGFNGHGNGLLIFPKFLFFFCRPMEV